MTASLRLFLVRHGQVPANREFRFIGTSEEKLSAEGELEADNLRAAFSDVPMDAVYASPRQRTLDTARRIVGEATSEPIVAEELAEQDFGDWEGLTREEIVELGAVHRRQLERFFEDPSVSPPNGESSADLSYRVQGFVEQLANSSLERVVLVSHVGPIKAILAQAMGLPVGQARGLFLDTGTVSVADWGPQSCVRVVNCRGALGWQTARWMT